MKQLEQAEEQQEDQHPGQQHGRGDMQVVSGVEAAEFLKQNRTWESGEEGAHALKANETASGRPLQGGDDQHRDAVDPGPAICPVARTPRRMNSRSARFFAEFVFFNPRT
jgi:hypothetical protein